VAADSQPHQRHLRRPAEQETPGKLATVIDQIEHGHHVFRACWKHAFLTQYEKFSRFLRNEICSNNLRDWPPDSARLKISPKDPPVRKTNHHNLPRRLMLPCRAKTGVGTRH